MKRQLVLIVGGAHCHACIDVIEAEGRFEVVGILDSGKRQGDRVLGYEVIGSDDDVPRLVQRGCEFLIAVGQTEAISNRVEIYERLKQLALDLPSVISPRACVSRYAKIGEGTIVMHGAIVNAAAEVKSNCIINTNSVVEHDALIGDHTHVSTASVVLGMCQIGSRVFVGSNSVIRHNLRVADEVTIGAGAVVTKPLDAPGVYVGSPARRIG